jgi:membrane protein implicated in regulation of membrane protease activity
VPRDAILPVLGGAALVVVCLVSFPWQTLLVAAALYVGLIPVSILRYRAQKRSYEQGLQSGTE